MKVNLKKISSALFAVIMLFGITACGKEETTFGTIDGVTIPVGVYINYQYMAYNNANTEVSEKAAEAAALAAEAATATATTPAGLFPVGAETTPATTVSVPLLEDSIDGVPVIDWINEQAIEDVREYQAINKKFADLGLAYTNGDDVMVKNYIEQNWIYFEEDLSKLGISRESYEDVMMNSLKRQEVFMHYYGPGGENAVSDDEIKNYLLENNARIDYIAMELKDGEGNLLKSEGKTERMSMAEEYITRATDGENFDTLLAEYNDYYTALQEAAKPAEETADEATDETAETAEETDPEDEIVTNETIITKDGTFPTATVVTKVFEEQAASPGETKYFIVEDEGGEYYYVVKLLDLFEDPAYLEDNRESVISELYSETFAETVKTGTLDQEGILNEKSMARYKAKKFEELYS
jgi:hypothetical protein